MLDSLDLLRAVGTLTPNQREALIDSVVLGRVDREIAVDMGITRQRVWWYRQAALKKLRTQLA